jgi:hypothetical protein
MSFHDFFFFLLPKVVESFLGLITCFLGLEWVIKQTHYSPKIRVYIFAQNTKEGKVNSAKSLFMLKPHHLILGHFFFFSFVGGNYNIIRDHLSCNLLTYNSCNVT